jgi:hypothetical protein
VWPHKFNKNCFTKKKNPTFMPLPNSAHFPEEAGPKRPPAQKTQYKSYGQAVKADRQVSLI